MKTLSEKIAVMQAAEAGKPIEFYDGATDLWARCRSPIWNWSLWDYRVALTKPSIDWSAVAPELDALATDSDGATYVMQRDKDFGYTGISWRGAVYAIHAKFFASFIPGTCSTEDSLVLRPGEVADASGWIP